MTSRPTVSISGADGSPLGDTHPLPAVFKSPIRPDIVQAVHSGMAKNKRQPYSVRFVKIAPIFMGLSNLLRAARKLDIRYNRNKWSTILNNADFS